MLIEEKSPVHLVAFFRDPGIVDNRCVEVVLDLHVGEDNTLRAGRNCWVKHFLETLHGLPSGITVAVDNGVRCPTPQRCGLNVYNERSQYCNSITKKWISTLKHPMGGSPGIAICDKDLACSLASSGWLHYRNGGQWICPEPFVNAVGDEVKYHENNAIILAHPVLFSRCHAERYRQAFKKKNIVKKLNILSRYNG